MGPNPAIGNLERGAILAPGQSQQRAIWQSVSDGGDASGPRAFLLKGLMTTEQIVLTNRKDNINMNALNSLWSLIMAGLECATDDRIGEVCLHFKICKFVILFYKNERAIYAA